MRSTYVWAAIGALVLVLVVGIVGTILALRPREQGRKLPAMGVVETHTLDDRTVMAVLAQASDLVTMKEDYLVQGHLTSFKELWGCKLPFTTEDTFIALHGTLGCGIDLSEVKVEVDNRRQIIYLTLPEQRVIFNELHDVDTVSEVLKDSWFNDTTFEEYSEFIAELKQSEQDAMMSDHAFLTKAEQHTQEVLTEFLRKADSTGEYVVVYR